VEKTIKNIVQGCLAKCQAFQYKLESMDPRKQMEYSERKNGALLYSSGAPFSSFLLPMEPYHYGFSSKLPRFLLFDFDFLPSSIGPSSNFWRSTPNCKQIASLALNDHF